MIRLVKFLVFFAFLASTALAGSLPFDTVFKGRAKFDALVAQADAWKSLPIGERTAAIGKALTGTRYVGHTLEIDDRIESPSVNFTGLDCWTFFETSLAFARMLSEPRDQWTPQTMLKYIEHDRYRGGSCDGSYLSRLHYLEEWLIDNSRRGLVADLTPVLGGVKTSHTTGEMSINWRGYRYIKANPSLRPEVRAMENRVAAMPFYHIPKSKVAGIESKLRSGDIIGITTRDPGGIGTSHVGLAYRAADGVLHFMHACSKSAVRAVIVDERLSTYLASHRTDAGIIAARPVK